MLGDILIATGVLLLGRVIYVVATLFLATDMRAWSKGLLAVERRALRWLAMAGMSEEERRAVERMRERIRIGLPPF